MSMYSDLKALMAKAGFPVSKEDHFTAEDTKHYRDFSHFVLGKDAMTAMYDLGHGIVTGIAHVAEVAYEDVKKVVVDAEHLMMDTEVLKTDVNKVEADVAEVKTLAVEAETKVVDVFEIAPAAPVPTPEPVVIHVVEPVPEPVVVHVVEPLPEPVVVHVVEPVHEEPVHVDAPQVLHSDTPEAHPGV